MRKVLMGGLALLAGVQLAGTAVDLRSGWRDYAAAREIAGLKQVSQQLLVAARDHAIETGLVNLLLESAHVPGVPQADLHQQIARHRRESDAAVEAALAGLRRVHVEESLAEDVASLQVATTRLREVRPRMERRLSGEADAAERENPLSLAEWQDATQSQSAALLTLLREINRPSLSVGGAAGAAEMLVREAIKLRQVAGADMGMLYRLTMMGEKFDPDQSISRMAWLELSWRNLREAAGAASLPDPVRLAVSQTETALFQRYLPLRRALLGAAQPGEGVGAERARLPELMRTGTGVLNASGDLIAAAINVATEATDQAKAAARQRLWLNGVELVLAILALLVAMHLIRRRVLLPIQNMTSAMRAVAGGDLSAPLPEKLFSRELRAMAAAVAVFKENARQLQTENRERRRMERQLTVERGILEMAAASAPLEEILAALCRGMEQQLDDALCSILLLREDGLHVTVAAAPNMPAEIAAAYEGIAIGPEVGSCGTAIYRRVPVIVTDVENDPRWEKFKHIVLPHGLCSCWSLPILTAEGEALGAFAIYGRQVREPKDWEMERARRAVQLASLTISSRRAAEQLEQAKAQAELGSRTKTEFLANMSHELRTPLNAIIGFAEVLESELQSAEAVGKPMATSAYAGDIIASGRHLLTLINDILDVSKMEAGRVELRERICGVEELVRGCERIVRARAMERRLNLVVQVAEGMPPILVDDVKFKQIVLNLLSNAVKFTAPGGTVKLVAGVDPARGVSVAVSDTGIGIKPDDLAKVFVPFHQVDNVYARSNPGTGLGLTLSKGLTELHGGRLTIDSVFGEGTTVTVNLPPARIVWTEAGTGLPLPLPMR
ncbi:MULTISPECIES: ATP-binding protein [unclassified Azospirillum]|uniref:ATP-binding protein n=1 Tax=unclassified Azospirillum TaxID=2630922 RepID=UPI000B65624A|nr:MULTISPECIES: ATP-binding protein [unclassified Azospirillum]SNT06132.1 HAMP domain-containing protein [Azospirillum sp. RU38E]SNT21224.1 HAMP domain-containing protein [Azospirillum sp. RU37A]